MESGLSGNVAYPDGVLVGLGVVQPWLCDAMDHLTTRHYVAIFDDAAYELLRLLGNDSAADRVAAMGWADVRHEINYRSELKALASYRVIARYVIPARTSLTFRLEMVDVNRDILAADMTAKTVRFDLKTRNSAPLDPAIAIAAKQIGELRDDVEGGMGDARRGD